MHRLLRLLAVGLVGAALATTAPRAASPDLVISQVYGGGGNAGATYISDFIELYNRSGVAVDVTGWTVQYASATGTSWQTTMLSGVVAPGGYYLVQEASGTGGSVPLPTPDAIGTIAMSGTTGKVALVRATAALSGACPSSGAIADLVGFGAANCSETSPTPALSNTTAALRLQGGAIDTDVNTADFLIAAPTPRSSGSTVAPLTGIGSATPPAIAAGASSLLTVAVTPASLPASTGIAVRADLSALGGSASQAFTDDGTGGDLVAGDNIFSLTVTPLVEAGSFTLPVTISDAQGRTAATSIAIAVVAPSADVVISQVYGGGGNSGADYRNDFIELRNREAFEVNVAGWSVQYTSANGTAWSTTPLSGVIPAGGYYLVQEAAGSGGTLSLPAPDAVGTLALSATSGKVALVTGPSPLTGTCPLAAVRDFVGYGAANCYEGSAPAAPLSNTTAAVRLGSGAIDNNDNLTDFMSAAPAPKSTRGVPPAGTGAATPSSLPSGGVTLLTVSTIPGAFPPSPITSVIVDLGPLGGPSQPFFDDATHGDVAAGDGVYSYQTSVVGPPGFLTLNGVIADARGRSGTVTLRLAIEPATTTSIAQIQGDNATSPLAGQLVTTGGVVTALRASGFYIQMPDGGGDGDPATSDGLFVFTSGGVKPAVGDAVRVTGVVSEFQPAPPSPPLTELAGGPVFAVVASAQPLPAPVRLGPTDTAPNGGGEQLESYEGMRVSADLLVVAPTDGTVFESDAIGVSNGQFYGVIEGLARPVREPGLDPAAAVPPGLPCCVPRFDGNPERLRVDSGAQTGSTLLDVAANQHIVDLTGVLDYAFGSYTILPDPGAGLVVGSPTASPVPIATADEFTIGSANLERFFDERDDPDHDDAVLTVAAVNRRLQKASLMVRDVLRAPDILGVVEVENLSILQRLAARINADAAAATGIDPMYVAFLEEGNDIGGIDSGFLVKSSRVDVLSVEQVGKETTYTPPGQAAGSPLPLLNDRPPLVLTAAVRGAGGAPLPVTVIVNHLRSLSGVDGPDGDRIRTKRRAQAEFLASLIQGRQGTERVVSIGDYNAFQFNDGFVDVVGTVKGQPTPADQVALASPDLVTPDLINLGDTLGPAEQYSFVFDGNAQDLDHVLVNTLAFERFTRLAFGRSNGDFPESLRGDASRPERLSDHDAVVAYFAFPSVPIITLAGASPLAVEAYTSFTDPGATAHDGQAQLPVTVSGSVDVNTPGDYILTYSATNGVATAEVTRLVRVRDTIRPAITGFAVTPDVLSPANRQMVDVRLLYTVADASNSLVCTPVVASTELASEPGGGNTEVDWVIVDAQHVQLRAERTESGNGRTYFVSISCADPAGNAARALARILVPK